MSDRDLVLAIVDRLAVGTATDEDREQLNAALQRDPGCIEIYARAMRQQRLLRGLLAEGASADAAGDRAAARLPRRSVRPRLRPRARPRYLAWAVAASLLVALGAFAWMARPPAENAMVVIAGNGSIGASALAVGDVIAVGTQVSAASGGLELRAGDGSHIALTGGALLALRSDDQVRFEAELVAGSAQFTVRPQARERRFAITTPQAVATVRGTAFTLAIDAGVTRIVVSEGLVGFRRLADGRTVEVAAGEEASTAAALEQPQPGRSIWRVNLGGPGLVIDGVAWDGQQEAEQRGLRCSASRVSEPKQEPVLQPEPDPGTRSLLATGVWELAVDWRLTLPVEPGDYLVRVWVVENHPLNEGQRRFDVVAEGRELFTDIGTLPLGGWRVHGPARVSVSEGALDLDCIPHEDDAHLMAIEVLPAPR